MSQMFYQVEFNSKPLKERGSNAIKISLIQYIGEITLEENIEWKNTYKF